MISKCVVCTEDLSGLVERRIGEVGAMIIVVAAFEAPTLIGGLNDVAVMGQPVQ
jgi:hypothetical protein